MVNKQLYKKEKGLVIVFPPDLVYNFSGKMFLMIYPINWPNFIVWWLYFLRNWAICALQLFFFSTLWYHKFWNNLIFLIKPFFCMTKKPTLWWQKFWNKLIFLIKPLFYMTKKPRQKFRYLENKRWNKRRNKMHISSFLKRFQLPKIVSDMRVHL